jgi:hypothetical protein
MLRQAFAELAPQVDRWLTELDRTPVFYFDSITQLRTDSWCRGRVTLVGEQQTFGVRFGVATDTRVQAYRGFMTVNSIDGDWVQAACRRCQDK